MKGGRAGWTKRAVLQRLADRAPHPRPVCRPSSRRREGREHSNFSGNGRNEFGGPAAEIAPVGLNSVFDARDDCPETEADHAALAPPGRLEARLHGPSASVREVAGAIRKIGNIGSTSDNHGDQVSIWHRQAQ